MLQNRIAWAKPLIFQLDISRTSHFKLLYLLDEQGFS